MDVRRTGCQIERLAERLGLSCESEIAETGSRYYRFNPNCDDSFTVRVSDHGQVYGNPKFCIDPDGFNTYKEVKAYLVDLARREREWEAANA